MELSLLKRTIKYALLPLCCIANQAIAQLNPIATFILPTNLNEISGMCIHQKAIYLHNDGGDGANIYKLDTLGQLLDTFTIANASNRDWEAMQITPNGHLYMADFGNNSNNRTDLRFYVVKHFLNQPKNSLIADTIVFSYANQLAFPPDAPFRFYDAEAFVYFNDNLYLFTKNRSNPYNGYTYMYQIPAEKGKYIALLKDSFFTGNGPKEFDWITDASLNETRLILLSHSMVYSIPYFPDLKDAVKINLHNFTQKEAVYYKPPMLWVADEKNNNFGGGNIYKYQIDQPSSLQVFDLKPYLSIGAAYITVNHPKIKHISVYDLSGAKLLEVNLDMVNSIPRIKNQMVILQTEIDGQLYQTKINAP